MKYLQNKYTKIYFSIITNRKVNPLTNEYTENHHILPNSMGGLDSKVNMIHLSAREHFICHYLLTKMLKKDTLNWYKMIKAFMMMKSSNNIQDRYINSRLYESKRIEFSKAQSFAQKGSKNSQYSKVWVYSIDEEKTKKIPKDEIDFWVSEGWKRGRKLNFDFKRTVCKHCNKKFVKNKGEVYCSESCRKFYKHKTKVDNKEYKFIELYKEHKSVNKSLQLLGYPGNVGDHSKWARKVLEKFNI